MEIRCLFNDNNPVAYKGLKDAVKAVEDIDIKLLCRDFEYIMDEIVDYVGQSFSFTFIDPKGWKGYDLHNIKPLLALRGEVLVNFMLNDVGRHLQDQRPEISSTFDSTFGGPGWRREVEDIMAAGQSREDAILEVFRERLRNFGSFSHVTSTRVLNPLSDRSYFHLVYGTRHWKGLVEFRHVEKKAVDVQEGVRDAAKFAGRMERTGQRELFGPGKEQIGPRFYEAERQKQLDAGFIKLCRLLKKCLTVCYEDLLGEFLNSGVMNSGVRT